MENALGSEHHEFLQWAASEGIVVQGVAPAKFPGRGLGMVATRTIQVSQSSPCNHNTKKKKKNAGGYKLNYYSTERKTSTS